MNAIDTNVLVYWADADGGDKRTIAVEWLTRLPQASQPTVLLWQVAVEFLNCMRRFELSGKITREETVGLLQRLENTFDYALPTIPVIHTALDLNSRYSLSHWDSLLVAACIEAGVTTLYSEDMADGADYDGVRIVNPFRNPLPE
ncbi:MAG TPA: PIN domain-containing protein [Planctomycetaceae bacterium]|nr:PIN domain-containing protein [Planctomycetaceae bacterium]